MITIGVLISNVYAEYSLHIIRGLCGRAKERGDVNLIFFPDILGSDPVSGKSRVSAHYCEDAVSLVNVLIISDQETLHKLLEQPEGSLFSDVLEKTPYILLKDDAGQVFEQACMLAEGHSDDAGGSHNNKEELRDNFVRALEFAMIAHKGQVRKGSWIPYIVHPIETALIAMTLTRDQDIIIAALFHDVIEDTRYGAEDIEDAFGSRIARLVQLESENKRKGQKASDTWKIRKQEFIDGLDGKTKEEKIIALSDKLSNMRATHQGYCNHGNDFWLRFNEKRKEMHHWYYRTVTDKLRDFADTDAWKELDRLVREVFEKENHAQQ